MHGSACVSACVVCVHACIQACCILLLICAIRRSAAGQHPPEPDHHAEGPPLRHQHQGEPCVGQALHMQDQPEEALMVSPGPPTHTGISLLLHNAKKKVACCHQHNALCIAWHAWTIDGSGSWCGLLWSMHCMTK